jgi:hypothetical protein
LVFEPVAEDPPQAASTSATIALVARVAASGRHKASLIWCI